MADYDTLRSARVGTRAAVVDEGLRAYMNKVYGLMSVGMLVTAAAAWAISGLATSDVATWSYERAASSTRARGWSPVAIEPPVSEIRSSPCAPVYSRVCGWRRIR